MTASQHGRISPPPLKRRKREPSTTRSTTEATAITPDKSTRICRNPDRGSSIRIVSWNINGIQPFIQNYLQKTLHSFFKPSGTTAQSKFRKRQYSPYESEDDSLVPDDPSKEGKATLRDTLRRQQWPEILFLQEIKIKPGDEKSMSAVRVAINDPISAGQVSGYSRQSPEQSSSESVPTDISLADGGPRYEAHFVLPSDPYNAKGFGGKVYGVAAIVRQDFMREHVEHVREPPWDREGRIQIIETNVFGLSQFSDAGESGDQESSIDPAKNDQQPLKLAIINVYAVNGTFNPYHSTHTGAVIGTRHDRKLAIHTELLQEAHRLESLGFSVVIAGDLNVARERIDGFPNLRTSPHQHVLNRADFNQKFFTSKTLPSDSATVTAARYHLDRLPGKNGHKHHAERPDNVLQGINGIDTFRHVNRDLRKYSWHSRTRDWGTCCDRVDLILASRTLEERIAGADICDNPRDRGPSDHCPIWVDISRDTISEKGET